MKAMIVAAGLATLSALASAAPMQAPGTPPMLTDIRWDIVPANGSDGDEPRLRVRSDNSSSDFALDGSRPELAGALTALGGAPGPVAFRVVHPAGTLDCDGRLSRRHEGKGDCRFAPDAGFARQLANRGLAPNGAGEQLAMLMVDATVELADGLADAGLKPEGSDDLIAAAALKVSPAYVRELRGGALTIDSIGDVIACRALGVDGGYVRELAAAGYANLDAGDVVGMKALGVTGDYARRMNAAATGGSQ